MTIETEIAALTSATTDLLNAVNVRKASLDQKVQDAANQAALATTNGAAQVALAAIQAANASNSAGASAASATDAAASATDAAASATKAAGYAGLMLAASTSDSVIRLNPRSVTADLLIPPGFNAGSAGPLVIADRVTVTVSDHSTWSIQ